MTEETKYTITVKEAMDILDVSRKTIYRRLRDGELDGKKVVINDTRKWLISEDSVYDNKVINETVKLDEVDKSINKEQLMNDLSQLVTAINGQNRELIEDSMQEVNDKIAEHNELIKKKNELLQKQIEQQNKRIRQVEERLQQQDQSILDKIKDFFK